MREAILYDSRNFFEKADILTILFPDDNPDSESGSENKRFQVVVSSSAYAEACDLHEPTNPDSTHTFAKVLLPASGDFPKFMALVLPLLIPIE